ncbi:MULTISPECIES: restriction endonuclease [unclassified Herbaspirillum]|uniref:restriction endonuclease n=1 Tax=unclassified Herbaspirillum TaxID=2624150 RepID=UPI000C0A3EEC|nr:MULTISPECIES: restriction endonuclease [unclassified Herbaspirillum]MAF05795.1 restriction endonuclease [Herbaspirillum sp.]MBO16448.1 restriction endonuclease [Herbaspirillum sp.]|tara:strand:+ start:3953 stop:4993 length:1041 start_codon:yes stop_codon:yes gene_type:complete
MSIWLIRAGSHGEYEHKFIQENRVYVTWDDLDVDLAKMSGRSELTAAMTQRYSEAKPKTIQNWVSQVWPFAHEMKIGDLVVIPLKSQPAVYIGEITGDYQCQPSGPSPFFHSRTVKWIGEAIPRTHFGKDLLFSFGAFMTICRIKRNNAEQRIAVMRNKNWAAENSPVVSKLTRASNSDEETLDIDLEESARDKIAAQIMKRFKGHGLTRLIEGILKAQGYTTYRSPEGADGGADILAGSGPLGFSTPRLCIEVKSEDNPIGREPVDKLLGAMTKFNADQGLFVAWGGFKGNVQKEMASQFFRLRLWTQKEILEQLFEQYDRLDEDLKAELPLKRVWMVASQEEIL